MIRRRGGLQTALERYCARAGAKVGVGYKPLGGGRGAWVRGSSTFSTASVFKVFVLADLLRRFDEGRLDPATRVGLKDADRSTGSGVLQYVGEGAALTLRDYARLMVTVSDNTAADVLFDYLGPDSIADTVSWLGLRDTAVRSSCKDILTYELRADEVRRYLRILGLDGERLAEEDALGLLRKNIHRLSGVHPVKELAAILSEAEARPPAGQKDMAGDDVTSPRDLVTTFERVYSERVLGTFNDEFLEILAACETGANRIRRGVPRGVVLAHKTGTLRGVVNDAGIVMDGERAYAIAVLVNDIPTGGNVRYTRRGEKIISDVSTMVWRAHRTRI
ncbi:MAG: serine hydrolase [Nitrososphaerota archaeon]|nr:serine hydrolase [Nitrososphaerota archaeon]MDG7026215.1 serine hydrolase [Nitrososphaerota archaeon]